MPQPESLREQTAQRYWWFMTHLEYARLWPRTFRQTVRHHWRYMRDAEDRPITERYTAEGKIVNGVDAIDLQKS